MRERRTKIFLIIEARRASYRCNDDDIYGILANDFSTGLKKHERMDKREREKIMIIIVIKRIS